MFFQSVGHSLDLEAISGICGSVSIVCWVVVFSPQIIENFRKSSSDGLSIEFVLIWLAGDVFNILGAVLQGVLPTMIILAIYYTFADIVLMAQCFYYRGFTLRDPRPDKIADPEQSVPTERTPLVANDRLEAPVRPLIASDMEPTSRTRSRSAFRDRLTSLDATHLSPAFPMHHQPEDATAVDALKPSQPRSWIQAILFNGTAIILVVLAGIAGYYLSPSTPEPRDTHNITPADEQMQSLKFSLWGQIFGYICAVLYLGSRLPQLLLNYRRKSTDGLAPLFFLFAVLGNLTFSFSIFAFEPICSSHSHGHWHESNCVSGEASRLYWRYILVNLSWLIGSLGTLFLDMGVFVQFWMYQGNVAQADAVPKTADGEGRGREPNDRTTTHTVTSAEESIDAPRKHVQFSGT